LGGSSLKAELEKRFETKPFINDKRVVVKEFKSTEQISSCQILIIPSLQSNKFEDALAKVNGKHTLIITDKDGMGRKGSAVNFIKVNGKLRFELNKSALQKNNILASSEIESFQS
jgi:hypothetical protein